MYYVRIIRFLDFVKFYVRSKVSYWGEVIRLRFYGLQLVVLLACVS